MIGAAIAADDSPIELVNVASSIAAGSRLGTLAYDGFRRGFARYAETTSAILGSADDDS